MTWKELHSASTTKGFVADAYTTWCCFKPLPCWINWDDMPTSVLISLLDPGCWYILNDKQCRSRSVRSKRQDLSRFSRTRVKKHLLVLCCILRAIRQPLWLSWMRVWLETRRSWVSTPTKVGNILLWRLIMKYFLSLPLIQEGQLSVFGERMCTILVNRLED